MSCTFRAMLHARQESLSLSLSSRSSVYSFTLLVVDTRNYLQLFRPSRLRLYIHLVIFHLSLSLWLYPTFRPTLTLRASISRARSSPCIAYRGGSATSDNGVNDFSLSYTGDVGVAVCGCGCVGGGGRGHPKSCHTSSRP